MPLAILLAAVSALLGGALALLGRRHGALLERTRTFAFAAAAGVVFFHLLPEVLPALGARALLLLALGFALPGLLERSAAVLGKGLRGRGFSGLRAAAEVGFAALVLHSLLEGLTLFAALQEPGSHADLEIALVAHHAPLTAAVALPFLELLGARAAAVRVAFIALAGAAGALAGGLLPQLGGADPRALAMAAALMAGALLHVAADEIRPQRFAGPAGRAADLLACAAGLALAALGGLLHARDGAAAQLIDQGARSLLALALAAAPAVLVSAIALSIRPRRTGAPGAITQSALIQSVLGPGALLVTAGLLGPGFASARVLLALAALLLFSWLQRTQDGWIRRLRQLVGAEQPPSATIVLVRAADDAFAAPQPAEGSSAAGGAAGFAGHLLERTCLSAPRFLFCLVLAMAAQAFVPPDLFSGADARTILLGGAALGLAAAGSPNGAVPLAAVLIGRGFPAPLAVVALALGPWLSSSSPLAITSQRATRWLIWGLLLGLGVLAERLCDWLLDPAAAAGYAHAALAGASLPVAAQAGAAPLSAGALALLGALALSTMWRMGARGWFVPLRGRRHTETMRAAEADVQRAVASRFAANRPSADSG